MLQGTRITQSLFGCSKIKVVSIATRRMTLVCRRFLPTTVFTIVLSLSASAMAAEYKGTCYFNTKRMPCSVSQNPFTLTMRWSDGVTETYSHQGNGVFIDARGGIWKNHPDATQGILLQHKNGNSVGFIEN